jgi:hypothetical protein
MQAYGEWMYRSTFSWPRHELEVSGQLHAPAALPPGKEPPVPIGQEVAWTSEASLDDLEKKWKFLPAIMLSKTIYNWYKIHNVFISVEVGIAQSV